MAHCNVGIVAADEDLSALGHHASLAVDAGVDDGLFAAGADGFDLGDGVGDLKESATALLEPSTMMGKKGMLGWNTKRSLH